jgi:hypothetical protein
MYIVSVLEETLDAEKSFAYTFEDKEWPTKLGLGALISMIPILNFAWSGYLVEIIRNVMDQTPEPLPAWDDLEKKFKEGLLLFAAGVIYASPVLIALCLPLGVSAFSGLFSGNRNIQDVAQMLTETAGIVFLCLLCVFLLYGLVFSILYPAILILFSREGTFASCFKLREAVALIRKNAAAFFTAWSLSVVASIGVGLLVGFVNMVVGFVPCIGWIIGLVLTLGSGVYSTAVYAHLFGQFGRIAFGGNQLAPVIPAGDPPEGSGLRMT